MAKYYLVNYDGVAFCDKCQARLGVPWFWALSKQAQYRRLCEPCHDIKVATDQLRTAMYATGKDSDGR